MGFSRWVGGYLGLLAIVLRFLAELNPHLTEKWYSITIYPLVRAVLDYSFILLPFPAFYLILLLLLYMGYRSIQSYGKIKIRRKKLMFFPRVLINFFGWIIFLFLILWGYNYYRIPLYQHLSLNPEPLPIELLLEEMEATQESLLSIRRGLQADSSAIAKVPGFSLQNSLIRQEMKDLLNSWGHSWRGKPLVKQFYPVGSLRKLGIFGIYFPFTGEAYLDPSLHPLEKSFTMAHELAHGFGITNEGEANFMAWLVCSESKHPYIQYAATMKLFRYQLNGLYKVNEDNYSNFVGKIPKAIKRDIREIQTSNSAIKPFSLELSRRSNDLYLKSQGVREGVNSYAQLPMLAHAWKTKNRQAAKAN
jgi:hypothetical protein|tara:strand:+ start:3301 stop:4386 length:1086 start_codon:yes stop_codon:yes gene_type:complete